jgi:hypothetical protein
MTYPIESTYTLLKLIQLNMLMAFFAIYFYRVVETSSSLLYYSRDVCVKIQQISYENLRVAIRGVLRNI